MMGRTKHELASHDLERIYDEHVAAMFSHGLALLSDESAVRDLLQNVFLKLAAGKLDGTAIENERGYLLRMVHHAAIDCLRRNKVRRDHAELAVPALFESHPDPDREAFRQALEFALQKLPAEQREVVVLKLWQELTFEEISQICEIPVNTAASRYRYGLDKLRHLLRPLYEEL
jgi:RNA polymerase sigma-70 factor (ECF subfamily)